MPTDAAYDRARNRRAGQVKYLRLLALTLGLALEFYSGRQGWIADQSVSLDTVILLLCGALLTAAGLCHFSQGNIWLAFWLYLALSLFLPLYGVVGSLVMALYLRYGRSAGLADQYAEEVDDAQGNGEEGFFASGSIDQMVRQELAVQSYMDIMRGPDRLLKKSLIGKILGEWTANAVPLLKQGLKDPEYEIRSYASTALTTIENRTNKNILHLKEEIAQDPGNVRLNLKLARSYLDYAGSGLLDRSSADHYVHMARETLTQIHPGTADDGELSIEALSLRAQTARLGGDTAAEKAIYEEILSRHSDHHETLSYLCDLHFRERDFAALRRTARLFLGHTGPEHPAFAAARYWSGETGEEEITGS